MRMYDEVRYGGIRRGSASPRPPCDGTPSASVSRWSILQADARPAMPYPSDGTPPDATMKRVGAPSAWTSPSDLDKKESDEWDRWVCIDIDKYLKYISRI